MNMNQAGEDALHEKMLRAAWAVGGVVRLAGVLQVSVKQLEGWLRGDDKPSRPILIALEALGAEPDASITRASRTRH